MHAIHLVVMAAALAAGNGAAGNGAAAPKAKSVDCAAAFAASRTNGKAVPAQCVPADTAAALPAPTANVPCPQKTKTEIFICLNELRDKKLVESQYPWMDLAYEMDAALVQIGMDWDARRITDAEAKGRIAKIGYDFKGRENERLQRQQATAATQAQQQQQAAQQASQQAAQAAAAQAQADAERRRATWQGIFGALGALGSAGAMNQPAPPASVNIQQNPMSCTTMNLGGGIRRTNCY